MLLIEALEQGLVPELGKPEKIITTFISKLFIYSEQVFKVYKHEPFFFADLSAFKDRKGFFAEDFFWNNTAAPEIYQHLWGVKEQNGTFVLVPAGMGEDFMIEMRRIDDSKTLTKLLLAGKLSEEDAALFIDSLVDILRVLTRERRNELDHLFKKGLLQIMRDEMTSYHSWLEEGQSPIDKKEIASFIELLQRAVENIPYFTEMPEKLLSVTIDNNSSNVLILEGKPSYIDIMPPLEIWRVVDEYSTIARTVADMEVLGGQKLGNAAREAYRKYGRAVPQAAQLAYEIRGAGIQWTYRHQLGEHDVAERFGNYTKTKMKELEALL